MVEGLAMIPGLYTYAATAIVAGALAFGGGWKVQAWRYDKQVAVINAAHATEREAAANELAVATTKARETEQTLTRAADKIKEETHAQIADLDARAAALARRLRDAAATNRLVSATASTTSAGEVAAVCDAGWLSDRAGSDLVGLVTRAEKIRLQLASCEAQYDGARAALMR